MDRLLQLCLQSGPLGDLIMHNGTGSALAFHALFIAYPRSSGATRFVLHAAECKVSHDGRKHLHFDWLVSVFHGKAIVIFVTQEGSSKYEHDLCRFMTNYGHIYTDQP